MKIKTSLLAITLFLWSIYSYAMETEKNEPKKEESADFYPITLKLAIIDKIAQNLASYLLSEEPYPTTYPTSPTLLSSLLPNTPLSVDDPRLIKLTNIRQIFKILELKCPQSIFNQVALMFFLRILLDTRSDSDEFRYLKAVNLRILFFFQNKLNLSPENERFINIILYELLIDASSKDPQFTINTQFDKQIEIAREEPDYDKRKSLRLPHNSTLLHIAVQVQSHDAISLLLLLNADPNLKNANVICPLRLAIHNRYEHATEILCSSFTSKILSSVPLSDALLNRDVEFFTFLIEYPFALYDALNPHRSPIHMVLSLIDLNPLFLKKIIEKLQDREHYNTLPSNLKCHLACAVGDKATLEQLDSKEVNKYQIEGFDRTLLHTAANFGQANIAKMLLNKGALVDPVSATEITPLWQACASVCPEIVKLLLAAGANPAHSALGTSCLQWAENRWEETKKGEYQTIIDMLKNALEKK
jgi:ankyrin repeat protein